MNTNNKSPIHTSDFSGKVGLNLWPVTSFWSQKTYMLLAGMKFHKHLRPLKKPHKWEKLIEQ